MAFRYFPGATQAELEAQLTIKRSELFAVSIATSGGAGDVSFAGNAQTSAREIMRQILYDLYTIDPTTYPKSLWLSPRSAQGIFRDIAYPPA